MVPNSPETKKKTLERVVFALTSVHAAMARAEREMRPDDVTEEEWAAAWRPIHQCTVNALLKASNAHKKAAAKK